MLKCSQLVHEKKNFNQVIEVQLMIFMLKCLMSVTFFKMHQKIRRIDGLQKEDWRRQWQPTPVLLPGKSHGRRGLVGCSPWGHQELDMTQQLHFIFSLSCIGEGNGNPLQCSCLENPRDGGAWWAAIYEVAQSRTQLKQLSSSSSSRRKIKGLSNIKPTPHQNN